MKILYIITKFESFDLFLSDAAVSLAIVGHEVSVLCGNKEHVLNEGRYRYDDYNIQFNFINFARGYNLLALIQTSVAINKIIKSNEYDKVSVHFTSGIFPTILLGKLANYTIGTFHGLNHTIEKNIAKKFIFKCIEYFCAARIDEVITINDQDYKALKRSFSKKTFRLPTKGLGCDLSRFNSENYTPSMKVELRRKLGINENDFVISYIGRFVSFKGFSFVVKTFQKLVEVDKSTSFKLLLIGDNDTSHATGLSKDETLWMEQQTAILKIGFVFNVEDYLAITDCLFLPSIKEGVPISITEALAMLIPTVSVFARGNIDLIDNGKNGILLENNKDVDKAVEAIQRIQTNSEFKANLIKEMIISRATLDRKNFVDYELRKYSHGTL